MSDTTITPEERGLWASVATARINAVTPERQCEIAAQERLVKALKALEQAEAETQALEEDMEATEKSLKEYSGFFADFCTKLQERFPKQYAELEGDEYGGDAFGVHEVFEHVIDPVIQGVREQAEARAEKVAQYAGKCAAKALDKAAQLETMRATLNTAESRAEKAEAENARLRAELETAKQVAASAQAVAQEAWAGEIPSPLPGHKRANEEELLAQVEHLNCPLCGGSGHIGDCEGD